MSRVSFIGIGTMGAPMAARLANAGHTVYATDTNLSAVETISQFAPIIVSPDARDHPDVDAVILSLPNSKIVDAVLGSADDPTSLVRALRPGTLVIDMSSSRPESTQRTAEALRPLGLALVDAPVSGGPSKAATGELSIMAGGSEEEYARALPILESLGTSVAHTGVVGSAHALKALNNILSLIGMVGALEVLAVGKKFGLEPQLMLDVINKSTGRNQATEVKIGQQVLTRNWGVGFSLALTVKDVDTALELGAMEGISTPVADAAANVARQALEQLADRAPDQSQIAEYIEHVNTFRYDD